MKTALKLALLLTAFSVFAGQVCFNIPPNDTPRVANAVGNTLHLTDAQGNPRPANQQEVTQFAQDHIIAVVMDYERRQAAAQYTPSPPPAIPTVTPAPTAAAAKKKK